MGSTIAWLDTSAEEQRRVREMISLFSTHESRDELGLGQIRDVFSDTLFPGTSVIQTRARYFLIVPWVFTSAARRGRSGTALYAHANATERRLIDTFLKAGVTDGLIGKLAGSTVRILPSSIYWSGLRSFGILTHDANPERLTGNGARDADSTDELAARVVGDWDPTLPPMPEEFLQNVAGGLDIGGLEALWLRDRILAAAPESLLAYLLTAPNAPDPASAAPWLDSVAWSAPQEAFTMMRHAALFSLTMHGAALLYNLLVAERYEAADHSRVSAPVTTYRETLDEWANQVGDYSRELHQWDREAFWRYVLARNNRIQTPTRLFVAAWTEAVLNGTALRSADDRHLRDLVAERERRIKRSQSRLVNDKLLGAWSGESGAGQLTFRWPQVRRVVTDIHQGLASGAAS
ncbi:MAG: hypothetical protein QG597_2751 [Actinomycetota bacterium]|nr:hypothetical protein [Actinomycetota bacterium]